MALEAGGRIRWQEQGAGTGGRCVGRSGEQEVAEASGGSGWQKQGV
jgi:hypothetical protein